MLSSRTIFCLLERSEESAKTNRADYYGQSPHNDNEANVAPAVMPPQTF